MKIQLTFASPKELDTLKSARNVDKKAWHYGNEAESILELDTDTWNITCPQNQKSALITEWMADESDFSMKLKEDDVEGNFVDIDYPFAVAMVGQICNPGLLASFIGQLLSIYNMSPSKSKEDSEDKSLPPAE